MNGVQRRFVKCLKDCAWKPLKRLFIWVPLCPIKKALRRWRDLWASAVQNRQYRGRFFIKPFLFKRPSECCHTKILKRFKLLRKVPNSISYLMSLKKEETINKSFFFRTHYWQVHMLDFSDHTETMRERKVMWRSRTCNHQTKQRRKSHFESSGRKEINGFDM